jgi:glycosyltransferase involved in cell wall biosynthesis
LEAAETTQPKLSVIVASHNRRELLRRCLKSLCRQTEDPAGFEVIVADDGSDDSSAEMAEAFEAPFRLRVLRLPKSGHAAAQNAAIERAEAPVCLLLDDDVVASPELVAAHIAGHRDAPATIGVGALTQGPLAANDWYAHAFARGWGEHYAELSARDARWTDCYGANLSVPRETLLEIGGVSTDLPAAKDFDLALRLRRAGCVPVYLPRAHGTHDDQKRRDRMLADARRQGAMHVELATRFPEAASTLLDWRAGAGPHELALRRAAIATRFPPSLLAWMGRFVPGDGRKMIWLHFVRRLAFWIGIRRSTSRRGWDLVTHDRTAEAVAEGLTG